MTWISGTLVFVALTVYERNANFGFYFCQVLKVSLKNLPLVCILLFSYGTVNELILLTKLLAKIFPSHGVHRVLQRHLYCSVECF